MQQIPQVTFEVYNTVTHIHDAWPSLLDAIDSMTSYQTEVADLREMGLMEGMEEDPYGHWDGVVRKLKRPSKMFPNPRLPTGLIIDVIVQMKQWGFPYRIWDCRERPEEGMPELVDIPLRDYQQEGFDAGIRHGRGVYDMVPRSGKTRLGVCLVANGIALPTAWIAPTSRIVEQTQRTFETLVGKHYAYTLVGSSGWEDVAKKNVVVMTASTAGLLPKEFWTTRQCLVVDEWHHGAAKTYRNIWKKIDHIYYRFGLTGTHYRSNGDDLEMHSLISGTLCRVTAGDLKEKGFLVPTQVYFVPVPGKLRCPNGSPKTFNGGFGKYGIHEHVERNRMIAYIAQHCLKLARKVIILVGTKKQGKMIADILKPLVVKPHGTQFHPVEFVSTNRRKDTNNAIIDAFNETTEVQCLIGTSLIGEGVDLPPADTLIYAKGEKAPVTLKQNAYRVCTAVEGKKNAWIIDFADRHSAKLLRHTENRARVYLDDELFEVEVKQNLSEMIEALSNDPAP